MSFGRKALHVLVDWIYVQKLRKSVSSIYKQKNNTWLFHHSIKSEREFVLEVKDQLISKEIALVVLLSIKSET